MTLTLPTSSDLTSVIGVQEPRIGSWPEGADPRLGELAVRWCRDMGFTLYPWQELVLKNSLLGGVGGERWASQDVGLVVTRQQGKTQLLIARMMFGLFMLPHEKTIVATAHLVETAKEAFRDMVARIDEHPELKARVAPRGIHYANGTEGIELKDGSRIRFKARSGGSIRGWQVDLLVADEAYDLTDDEMAALRPTLTQSRNPQFWYASSTGMPDSYVLNSVRERGIDKAPGLAYFEWSAPPDADNKDVEAIRQANPSLGISNQTLASIFGDCESMEEERYRRERLGILAPIGEEGFIPPAKWSKCLDSKLAEMVTNGEVIDQKLTRVALGVDVPPDRSYGSVCVSGFREDGSHFVELLAREIGTDWLPGYLADLLVEGGKVPILADGFSAVSAMALELRQNRVPVKFIRSDVYKKACGVFYDKVVQGQVAHKGDADLDAAVAGAVPSSKDKLWAWTSKSVDVSPLVAATLAVHGSLNRPSGGKTTKRRGAVFA